MVLGDCDSREQDRHSHVSRPRPFFDVAGRHVFYPKIVLGFVKGCQYSDIAFVSQQVVEKGLDRPTEFAMGQLDIRQFFDEIEYLMILVALQAKDEMLPYVLTIIFFHALHGEQHLLILGRRIPLRVAIDSDQLLDFDNFQRNGRRSTCRTA